MAQSFADPHSLIHLRSLTGSVEGAGAKSLLCESSPLLFPFVPSLKEEMAVAFIFATHLCGFFSCVSCVRHVDLLKMNPVAFKCTLRSKSLR